MVDMVFRRLNVRVVIKLNNRKILAGIVFADKLFPVHTGKEITGIKNLEKQFIAFLAVLGFCVASGRCALC